MWRGRSLAQRRRRWGRARRKRPVCRRSRRGPIPLLREKRGRRSAQRSAHRMRTGRPRRRMPPRKKRPPHPRQSMPHKRDTAANAAQGCPRGRGSALPAEQLRCGRKNRAGHNAKERQAPTRGEISRRRSMGGGGAVCADSFRFENKERLACVLQKKTPQSSPDALGRSFAAVRRRRIPASGADQRIWS